MKDTNNNTKKDAPLNPNLENVDALPLIGGNEGYTKIEWTLQGPKIQKDFGNQTYYTIHPKDSYDIVGFFYPYSGNSKETIQWDAEMLARAPRLHEENKTLKSIVERQDKTINDLLETGSSKLSQSIIAKQDANLAELVKENKRLETQINYVEKVGYQTSVDNTKYIAQNAELMERNNGLKDALKWVEMKSWHKNEWKEMNDINIKVREAIANNSK